uniref:Uncharacterized protein n=1 Tax=Romanomermis culicivorax TaxID=13658 RepID=A0A915I152_ROMCU
MEARKAKSNDWLEEEFRKRTPHRLRVWSKGSGIKERSILLSCYCPGGLIVDRFKLDNLGAISSSSSGNSTSISSSEIAKLCEIQQAYFNLQ